MTALAAIHVAKKQLGLDEDTYRAVLMRVTGKSSAGAMSEAERVRVVEELRRQGFKPASKRGSKGARKRLEGRFAGKLQALWIAVWNLGLVEDREDGALLAFVKRQTRIDHTRFLRHPEDADAVIEALKAWMAREAGVDWQQDRFLPDWTQVPGYRIAAAQWDILRRLDPAMADYLELSHWVIRNVDINFRAWEADPRQWIAVMNALGERVRAAKAVR